jgi:hypothetical protein
VERDDLARGLAVELVPRALRRPDRRHVRGGGGGRDPVRRSRRQGSVVAVSGAAVVAGMYAVSRRNPVSARSLGERPVSIAD